MAMAGECWLCLSQSQNVQKTVTATKVVESSGCDPKAELLRYRIREGAIPDESTFGNTAYES